MRVQKIWGLVLIALAVMLLVFTSQGTTPDDRDGTAALILIPTGIYLLTSRNRILR